MSRPCILIIEDEEDLRKLFEMILSLEEYPTMAFASFQEAEPSIGQANILLLDCMLGNDFGPSHIARIKDINPTVIVVGMSCDETNRSFFPEGLFLDKPFELGNLVKLVARVADNR
jgi:DNA-binding NtrC family response regulator